MVPLLTKLRSLLRPLAETVGRVLGKAGISPNLLTGLGMLLAVLTPVPALFGLWWCALILMASASTLDFLDGAVAKALGRTSVKGAFLDSVGDRVSDGAFIITIYILGIPALTSLILMITSFLISYIRAKGESLSIKMEGVGLMERADRLIFLAAILIILGLGYSQIGYVLGWVMIALNLITIIHRAIHILRG